MTSLGDNGTTVSVKTLWTQDGFLLPDSHGIGALVDSGDEIYASEKKTNVAPQLSSSSSGVGNAVKREREEPAAVDAVPAAEEDAPAAEEAPAVATAKPAISNVKTEPNAETEPKAKKARGASAYNIYMSSAMTRWKAENPGQSHKEAFAACAGLWRSAPENPKNGGTASGGQSSGLPSTGVDQDSDAESGVRPAARVQLASTCASVRSSEKADVVADRTMIDCLIAVAMEPPEDDGDGEALGEISAIFAAAEKKKKKKEKKERKKKKKEKKHKEK